MKLRIDERVAYMDAHSNSLVVWASRPITILASMVLACSMNSAALSQEPTGHKEGYRWTANFAVAPPEVGKQRGETALATDSKDRVWLSYLDANYKQLPNGKWIAWPRKVVLLESVDQGKSFANSRILSEMGGDEALAADNRGGVYASWVQYSYDPSHKLNQKVVIQPIGLNVGSNPAECLMWDPSVSHDQSHIHIGGDGAVHVLGTDISPKNRGKPGLLYARSLDGGKTCVNQQRLDNVGELPQLASTGQELLIAGPLGYLVSEDNGNTFSTLKRRAFGDKLARLAMSPDRKNIYVVGDSLQNGLWVHTTNDGGKTWHTSRVDTATNATSWRYPAIYVDRGGRIHVVWMDDRNGFGAIFHAYSDDGGKTFSDNSRVSDKNFSFPSSAPPPPPATQEGTWIGDYLSVTTVRDKVIVAWSDQRAGPTQSTVYVSVGSLK